MDPKILNFKLRFILMLVMVQFKSYKMSWYLQLLVAISSSLIVSAQHPSYAGQRPQEVVPVAPQVIYPQIKILIPSLPPNHYRFWLRNHPIAFQYFEKLCSLVSSNIDSISIEDFHALHTNLSIEDGRYFADFTYGKSVLKNVCSSIDIVTKSCWGYENSCHFIYLMPECHGKKDAKDEQEKKIAWFSQADFGYILERRREMNKYCSPVKDSNDTGLASLECTKNFKTCRGQNLFIKFDHVPKVAGGVLDNEKPYQLAEGNIGGRGCDLQLKRIKEEGGQEGVLKSWFTELKNYNLIDQPKETSCDITIEKQAFIMKLDSPFNMYHYFCNFINLYATIHLNNKFSEDNEIIIWDNQLPRGKFEKMWSAFSKNPLRNIGEFDGKRVCFKKFIFTLPPRMVDGLYYNTQLVQGCSKTGLFDAFSKHVLHRLNVSHNFNEETGNKIISVTIIKRSTPYRRIINEVELEKAVKLNSTSYNVRLIDYEKLSFQEQLQITQNTDILVGIHGAGLTNLLFLPEWAGLIELYDCKDTCYNDLARLRGITYHTFQNKPDVITKVSIEDEKLLPSLTRSKLIDHEKYVNYRVNIEEFLVLLERASERVKSSRLKFFPGLKKNGEEAKASAKVDLNSGSTIDKKATRPILHETIHEEL